MGRAAKLAALKLRISRAGRALLGLAPGSSGKPPEAPGSFRSWETRAGGPAEVFLEALSVLALRALKHIAVERGATQSRGSSARTPGRPDAPSALPQSRQARSFFGSRFCAWDVRQSSRLLNFGFRVWGRPMSKLRADKLTPWEPSGKPQFPEASRSSGRLREASGRLREALQCSGKAHKSGAS